LSIFKKCFEIFKYAARLCRETLPVWGGGPRAGAGRGAGRADLPAKYWIMCK